MSSTEVRALLRLIAIAIHGEKPRLLREVQQRHTEQRRRDLMLLMGVRLGLPSNPERN